MLVSRRSGRAAASRFCGSGWVGIGAGWRRAPRIFIDRQCLVFADVTRIRVDRARLCVLIAGRLGQMLSLDRLPLRSGASLPRLSGAFVSFSLSTLGFGGLFVGRSTRAFRLDRTAPGLLAKLARLLTTTLVTSVPSGAGDDGYEQQRQHDANGNDDDRPSTHGVGCLPSPLRS